MRIIFSVHVGAAVCVLALIGGGWGGMWGAAMAAATAPHPTSHSPAGSGQLRSPVTRPLSQTQWNQHCQQWLRRMIQSKAADKTAIWRQATAALHEAPAPLDLSNASIDVIRELLSSLPKGTKDMRPDVVLDFFESLRLSEDSKKRVAMLKARYSPSSPRSAKGGAAKKPPASAPNADFWAKIKPPPASARPAISSQPTLTEQIFAAQQLSVSGKFAEAEAAYRRMLGQKQVEQRPALAASIQQGLLVCLLDQTPFPTQKAGATLSAMAKQKQVASAITWNLLLQLALKRVLTTPRTGQAAIWRQDVALLRPFADSMPLKNQTLAGLDALLNLPDDKRGVSRMDVLGDLMTMTPNFHALGELSKRRGRYLFEAGRYHAARYSAWRRVLFTFADSTPYPTASTPIAGDVAAEAIHDYATMQGQSSIASVDDARLLQAPASPGHAATNAAETATGPLAKAASGLLGQHHEEPRSVHRRVVLKLFAGLSSSAVRDAKNAVIHASMKNSPACFDNLAAAMISATGKLTAATQAVHWYAKQFNLPPTPGTSPGQADAFASKGVGIPGGPGGPGEPGEARVTEVAGSGAGGSKSNGLSRRQRLAILQNQARRRQTKCERLAGFFLNWGELESAAALEAASLSMNPLLSPQDASKALGTVSLAVRGLEDHDQAAKLITSIQQRVSDQDTLAHLAFIQATLLYEQGRMQAALKALDRAKPVFNGPRHLDQRMAAGLIRSVALIKLGRLDQAAKVLKRLEKLNAGTEQLAQVTFLEGWICLNEHQTDQAVVYFDRIVDQYPGSPYADKARQLIRRLQVAAWSK